MLFSWCFGKKNKSSQNIETGEGIIPIRWEICLVFPTGFQPVLHHSCILDIGGSASSTLQQWVSPIWFLNHHVGVEILHINATQWRFTLDYPWVSWTFMRAFFWDIMIQNVMVEWNAETLSNMGDSSNPLSMAWG